MIRKNLRWMAAVLLATNLAAVTPGPVFAGPNGKGNGGGTTTTPIKHVVVIFQENVSFDHYFATYPNALNTTQGEPGFLAAPNTPTVNGLTGALMTKNQNAAQPFRLSRAQAVTCDQDHNYADEQKAFNAGLMNKFVE